MSDPTERPRRRRLCPHPMDIRAGRNLRMARIAARVSQEALAAAVGITFQQIQKYERGANRMSLSRAWQFSQVLGIPVGTFFQKPGREWREIIETAASDDQLAQLLALYRVLNERQVLKPAIRLLNDIASLAEASD